MATTTLSVSNGNRGKIYTLTYSVSSSSTATTVTLTSLKVGNSSWAGSPIIIRFYADSTSTQITSITDDGWAVDSTHTINKTHSWNKAESAQTKHLLVYGKESVNGSEITIGTTDIEVSVPALAKYAVTYNANGGSGAPATQYKVYGKNLTLSVVKPTRSGFSFVKWFTKADGTGTGYNPGATYSTNAALNLYAKWSAVPSVTSLTVIRSDSSGNQDDSGTYASVTATWTMSSATSESATVTGTITPQGGTSSAITLSGTTTGTGGTVTALVPNMDTDTQYVVAITAANGSNTATRSAVLTRAFFIMDFKAGGGGIGIGRAAPSSGLEVGYKTVFDDDVDVMGELKLVHDTNESAILFQSQYRTAKAISFYGNTSDDYGDEIVIGDGGQVIIGAGESANSLHTALNASPGSEAMYVISDGNLYLYSHANTIANRTQFLLNNSNATQLYGRCGADNAVTIDNSSNNGVSSTTNIGILQFQDKNGLWAGSFGVEAYGSAGRIRSYLGLHNKKTDGTEVSSWFCLDLNKDGTSTYSIPSPENFCSAIGALPKIPGSTNLPHSTATSNVYPLVLGNSFANNGQISYQNPAEFRDNISAVAKPTQLYYNATGTDGTVSLSQTAANFNYLRIFFKKNGDSNACGSTDVYAPNGKKASLVLANYSGSTHQIMEKVVTISGTSITKTVEGYILYQNSNTGWNSGTTDTTLFIYRVEGWK